MSARNPKKVVDAFTPTGSQPAVEGVRLREFTAGTVLVLQQIAHPLVDGGGGAKGGKRGKAAAGREMDDMQMMQLVYVLAHPMEDVLDALAQGREAFDRAVVVYASTLPIGALPELGAAVAAAFERAVSTVLPGAGAGGPGAEKKTRSRR